MILFPTRVRSGVELAVNAIDDRGLISGQEGDKDGWMGKWVDGWVDGWMDGWMLGEKKKKKKKKKGGGRLKEARSRVFVRFSMPGNGRGDGCF